MSTISLTVPQQQVRSIQCGHCRVLYLSPSAGDVEGLFSACQVSVRGDCDPAGQAPLRLCCRGVLRGRTRRRGPVVAVFLGAQL